MQTPRTLSAALTLALLAGVVQAQPCETLSKLAGSPPAASEFFGQGVGMSFGGLSNRLLLAVGRPGRDAPGLADVGGWSVYQLNTNGTWFLIHDAVNTTGEAGEAAGTSIAISDPYMIVGAPEFGFRGRVRILRRTTGTNAWAIEDDLNPGLVPGVTDAIYGNNVAISAQEGGWAIVGAPRFSRTVENSGAVDVFYRNASGEWINTLSMVGTDGFGRLNGYRGGAVAMSQSSPWAAFGAPGETHDANVLKNGMAYVINRNAFTPTAITPPVNEAGQEFGSSVAIEGNWLLVGAPREDGSAAETGLATDVVNSGVVYLFERTGNAWVHRSTLRAPVPTSNALFGGALSMSDTQVVVTERFTRRLYVYRREGATCTLQATFLENDNPTDEGFAFRVAIRDGHIAASDHTDDAGGVFNAGAVYTATVAPTSVSGDLCGNAMPLPMGNFVGCTETATPSIGSVTTCGIGTGGQGPDVWFRFTPACSGNAIIDTLGSDFDTVLSVHSDCPSSAGGNSIVCNDDAGFAAPNNRASMVSFNFVGGQSYLVRVSGYNGASGQFTLRSLISDGVTNDECSTATTIGLGTRAFGTCGATNSPQAGVPLGSSRDVWYRFIAPAASTYTFDTCGSSFDTVITLFQGSQSQCPSQGGAMIAQNNDGSPCGPSSVQSSLTTALTQGQSVMIRVGGANANAFGAGTLRIAEAATCDGIDFNNDSLFPDDNDLLDFLNVLAGGPCSAGNTCNDIDFNNDGLFPDDNDLISFLRVLAGGGCN